MFPLVMYNPFNALSVICASFTSPVPVSVNKGNDAISGVMFADVE
jgi:hypothetical protein